MPGIQARPNGFGQALLRGRYMAAVARMEYAGVLIDHVMLDRFRAYWTDIKLDLIFSIGRDFNVYDGTSFKDGLFAGYLADNGIDWPRTAAGRLCLDQETFRNMAKRYPQLEPLKELHHSLSDLRLEKLAVGPDHRNRVLLSPFGASSGRNTPSNSRFIFGPSAMDRAKSDGIPPRPATAQARSRVGAEYSAARPGVFGVSERTICDPWWVDGLYLDEHGYYRFDEEDADS